MKSAARNIPMSTALSVRSSSQSISSSAKVRLLGDSRTRRSSRLARSREHQERDRGLVLPAAGPSVWMPAHPCLDGGAFPDSARRQVSLRNWEIRVVVRELVHALPRHSEHSGNLADADQVASHDTS